ncbi:MAG: hypothetical protein AAF465_07745 [Pseudomonadota bacterium]
MDSSQKTTKNPYLEGDDRLSDVLAGIQMLSTYRYYKVSFGYFQDRLKVKPRTADSWKALFHEHPEFFRVNDEDDDDEEKQNVCMLMRRAKPKRYNVDDGQLLTRAQVKALSGRDRDCISRAPLSSDEKQWMMKMAIDLHAQALARKESRQRFYAIVASIVVAVIGAAAVIAAAFVKIQK